LEEILIPPTDFNVLVLIIYISDRQVMLSRDGSKRNNKTGMPIMAYDIYNHIFQPYRRRWLLPGTTSIAEGKQQQYKKKSNK
jgi:hypothetical protein